MLFNGEWENGEPKVEAPVEETKDGSGGHMLDRMLGAAVANASKPPAQEEAVAAHPEVIRMATASLRAQLNEPPPPLLATGGASHDGGDDEGSTHSGETSPAGTLKEKKERDEKGGGRAAAGGLVIKLMGRYATRVV